MDDRDRRAPVALARDTPVTQAPLHLLLAELQGSQISRDRVHGLLVTLAIVIVAAIRGARVDTTAVRGLRIPVLPLRGRELLAANVDHLFDRQSIAQGESEIALIVRGDTHHRAIAVTHENVVADPDLDALAAEWMFDKEAGGNALLLHRRDVSIRDAAFL